MAKSFGLRKLHRPRESRHAADDLSVDEVSDPSAPQDESDRNGERIENRTEGPALNQAEKKYSCGAAHNQPMSRQAAEPDGWDQRHMLAVKRPLVVEHHYRS